MREIVRRNGGLGVCGLCFLATTLPGTTMLGQDAARGALRTSVAKDGTFAIGTSGASAPTLRAGVAAQVDGRWLRSSEYPRCTVQESSGNGDLGASTSRDVSCTGLAGLPDLLYRLETYGTQPFAKIRVIVRNSTGKEIAVQAIRSVDAQNAGMLALHGPASEERVLSDSFSEDRPAMRIHELGDPLHGMHRAVGSQLLYNVQTHESVFLGALSSEKFLTILRLHVSGGSGAARVTSYEVESAGTTELELDNSLMNSPAGDRVMLHLPVAPGASLSSEPILIGIGDKPQAQLTTYGELIHKLHPPRTVAPPLLGWWSWTAYYFGLNNGAALTNAEWEAEHLKEYGYTVFHIDEGYQYARGEYTTPNVTLFPNGLVPLEDKVNALGLTPGIWTAPFEVSERAWVYQKHPEWLVKNAAGKPIHAGFVVDGKEQLYVLDTTNPEAQVYLRDTYRELARVWGIRYIKMDFMDDSAIEGFYYKPHTTAMEAQRVGLQIIRDAVGDDVFLDKDGSVMMNPIGYVDYGRVSQDTGHSFDASRDAATGVAARFFMNGNYFVSDPDAFTVSKQRINDQSWHEGKAPLTLDEARVSMALAAVTGGMLEIGDNLPSLNDSPDRIALLQNRDLLNMVRLGKAAVPVDLMDYARTDEQPSMFVLKEGDRQTMFALFNWTEHATAHSVSLADLGLTPSHHYSVADVLDGTTYNASASGALQLKSLPHSVHMLKIVDQDVPASAPDAAVQGATQLRAGQSATFSAQGKSTAPAITYEWEFGDGVHLTGQHATHAWTEPGEYKVHLTSTGVDGLTSNKELTVHVEGNLPSRFDPANIRRPSGN